MQGFDLVVLLNRHTHAVVHDHVRSGEDFFLLQRHRNKLFGDGSCGRIDQADLTVLTCHSDGFAIGTESHTEDAARDRRAAELLHAFGDPFIQLRAFAVHRLNELLHPLRHGAVVITGVDVHRTGSFKRGACGDTLAIRREIHPKNAALHRWEFADEIRVVADHTLRHTLHAVDRRHTIRAANQHFIAQRMPRQHLHTTFKRARSDGGHVINKTLRSDFRELHTHVTTARDHMLAVHAPDGVQHPVTVPAHEECFLASSHLDGTHRIVSAAKCEVFSIR